MLLRAFVVAIVAFIVSGCGHFLFYAGYNVVSAADVPSIAQQINPQLDPALTSGELLVFFRGSTIVSRSLSDPSAQQFGYFGADGHLLINPMAGHYYDARWRVFGNTLCYDMASGNYCSLVRSANIVTNSGVPQSVLYFSRISTNQATVLITDVIHGNALPAL